MGFTVTSAVVATEAVEAAPIPSESDMHEDEEPDVAYRTDQPPPRQAATRHIHADIDERVNQVRHPFWRALTHQADTVIKANCTTYVITSANAIAEEVLRQQQAHNLKQHGSSVSGERWIDHTTVPDMVRGYGRAYRGSDDGGREV